MIDTIIVTTAILVAALYVGRRLYRQLSSKTSACGCSGCGQAQSCSDIRNGTHPSACSTK